MAVVVPTYRRTDSLATLLRALVQQDQPGLDIVLIDQNAGDEVDRAVDAALLGAVRRIRLPEPNVSTARNVGFLATTAPLVLFIDDDLVPGADFCRRAAELFRARPDIECLVPLVFTSGGPAEARRDVERLRSGATEAGLIPLRETISAALFFRRELFQAVGGFDELLFRYARTAEDQELFFRLRERGTRVWLDPLLEIFHDEGVPGGCELRTDDYWRVRERCVKAWAYTRRVHAGDAGRLGLRDYAMLLYSSSLNRHELAKGPANVARQFRLLLTVLADSRRFVQQRAAARDRGAGSDFLTPHAAAADRGVAAAGGARERTG